MASVKAVATVRHKIVGMGQIAVAQSPACLTAVLGSCTGVALYHRRLRLGALAHVVLPDSGGRTASPGKFADTAVPHLLDLLARHGATTAGLSAKLVGGACMFGTGGPMQIGDANVAAVTRLLHEAGVRISGKDIGGTSGRRICFDCNTGEVTIETVGNPPRNL